MSHPVAARGAAELAHRFALVVVTAGAACVAIAGEGLARADDIPCEPAEKGVIQVDGLLDDWAEVGGLTVGGNDSNLSFTVRCNYDERTIFLAVDVRDNYLVRTPAARPGEDHVEIAVANHGKVDRLLVFPEDGAVKQKLVWSTGKPLAKGSGITAAESRQPRGWSVEMGLPLRALPEWSAGVPLVHLAVGVADCDSKANPQRERFLSTSPLDSVDTLGAIPFAEAASSFDALLRDLHLSHKDVSHDLMGRVTPKGKGRVVAVGRYLGIVSDEYAYIELPIASPADLRDLQVMDLAGDGHDAIVARYVERGGGGVREVLAAYRMTSEGLRRVFGVETAKESAGRKLATRVSFARAKKGRGTEIVVEPLPAAGWTEASYQESPAEDIAPIALPWSKEKRQRFQFSGDGYTRVE